jgi:TM2 domain-containing membrane protein YozV
VSADHHAGVDDPADQPVPISVRRIVLRILFIVATLGVSTWILVRVFDDLDWSEVADALRSLDDAEVVALIAVWVLWIGSQGMQTASLIARLPVRRGVIAYLGPASVTSVVPGPSDLPVRFRMLRSWGYSADETTLAVAAGSIFNIGIKLALPVIAAIGLLLTRAEVSGTLRTITVVAVLVGIGMVGAAFILKSERRTAAIGRVLNPVWTFGLRLLRRPSDVELEVHLVAARNQALEVLRDRWLIASWSTVLTAGLRFCLLLLAVRATGVPVSAVSWTGIFVAYALVQGLTVLPITAGDTGVSEIAYISLLTAAAGSQYVNAVTAGVLLFRLLTWLVIIPVGLSVLGAWQVGERRRRAAVG